MNCTEFWGVLFFILGKNRDIIYGVMGIMAILGIHLISCLIWFFISEYAICQTNNTSCKIFCTVVVGIISPTTIIIVLFLLILIIISILSLYKSIIGCIQLTKEEYNKAKNEFRATQINNQNNKTDIIIDQNVDDNIDRIEKGINNEFTQTEFKNEMDDVPLISNT